MKIIINSIEHEFDGDSISYEDLIEKLGYSRDRILSVTFKGVWRGDARREGILSPGRVIILEDGLIFNISDTSNA